MKNKKISLALDSGAYSISVKSSADLENEKTKNYTNSPKFKEYLQKYADFLIKNKDIYDFYVTLDIIGDSTLTLEMQQYLETCGLKPLPVFHFGENLQVLKYYVENYNYIGIGGLATKLSKFQIHAFLDQVFSIVCDSKGKPTVKTHGFAVTANDLIQKYPFYSVDSTTWVDSSRFGKINVPSTSIHGNDVRFDYLNNKTQITVSDRAEVTKSLYAISYFNLNKVQQKYVDLFLEQFNLAIDDLKFSYKNRDLLNISFYKNVEKQLKILLEEKFSYGEGGNIYLAGSSTVGASYEKKYDLFKTCSEMYSDLKFLTSFWYPQYNLDLIKIANSINIGEINVK